MKGYHVPSRWICIQVSASWAVCWVQRHSQQLQKGASLMRKCFWDTPIHCCTLTTKGCLTDISLSIPGAATGSCTRATAPIPSMMNKATWVLLCSRLVNHPILCMVPQQPSLLLIPWHRAPNGLLQQFSSGGLNHLPRCHQTYVTTCTREMNHSCNHGGPPGP